MTTIQELLQRTKLLMMDLGIAAQADQSASSSSQPTDDECLAMVEADLAKIKTQLQTKNDTTTPGEHAKIIYNELQLVSLFVKLQDYKFRNNKNYDFNIDNKFGHPYFATNLAEDFAISAAAGGEHLQAALFYKLMDTGFRDTDNKNRIANIAEQFKLAAAAFVNECYAVNGNSPMKLDQRDRLQALYIEEINHLILSDAYIKHKNDIQNRQQYYTKDEWANNLEAFKVDLRVAEMDSIVGSMDFANNYQDKGSPLFMQAGELISPYIILPNDLYFRYLADGGIIANKEAIRRYNEIIALKANLPFNILGNDGATSFHECIQEAEKNKQICEARIARSICNTGGKEFSGNPITLCLGAAFTCGLAASIMNYALPQTALQIGALASPYVNMLYTIPGASTALPFVCSNIVLIATAGLIICGTIKIFETLNKCRSEGLPPSSLPGFS